MLKTRTPIDSLRDSLTWLAAPPEHQIAELLRFGAGAAADELACAFDDAVALVVWHSRPILPVETLDLLEHLDGLLTQLVDDPQAWTLTALCERIEWQRIRHTALRAIAALSDSRPTLERPVASAH
jgi:hypothetical protein